MEPELWWQYAGNEPIFLIASIDAYFAEPISDKAPSKLATAETRTLQDCMVVIGPTHCRH